MLITPAPGADRRNIRDALRSVRTAVENLRGGGGPGGAYGSLLAYLEWVNDTVRMLENQISAADIDRLVRTPGYEALLPGVGRFTGTTVNDQRVVNGLVSAEVNARYAAFDTAVRALESQIERWSRLGKFVVLDTSVYIEHPQMLEVMDVAPLISARPGEPVHILVPIVVVDELDGLKRDHRPKVRWRARYTLAVLDRVFKQLKQDGPATLASEGLSREVTIEIVFDPSGHVRLPINDDEIIDRALAIQPLAARPVTLVTYDTSQSLRARNAGLPEVKLDPPPEEEPKGNLIGR